MQRYEICLLGAVCDLFTKTMQETKRMRNAIVSAPTPVEPTCPATVREHAERGRCVPRRQTPLGRSRAACPTLPSAPPAQQLLRGRAVPPIAGTRGVSEDPPARGRAAQTRREPHLLDRRAWRLGRHLQDGKSHAAAAHPRASATNAAAGTRAHRTAQHASTRAPPACTPAAPARR